MEFKTEAHQRVYEKTRDFLHTLFGEVNVKVMDDTFVLQEGSTFVYVRAFPIWTSSAHLPVQTSRGEGKEFRKLSARW